jgi:hypothetical protein
VVTREKDDMLVIFANGEEKVVPAYKLDNLIQEKRIVAFLRSDGWAEVGRDPIRKGPPQTWSGHRWSDFMSRRSQY